MIDKKELILYVKEKKNKAQTALYCSSEVPRSEVRYLKLNGKEKALIIGNDFQAIDRNKDGFITRGELKLAKKNVGMNEIVKCITDHDLNKDGKLNMDEFEKSKKKK